jgi:adenosine deaminase
MPKIELHLHIEGSLEPELAFELADRNNLRLYQKNGAPHRSADEIRAAYRFHNLQEFLDLYYQGMSVLRTEQDFFDLTSAYLKKVAAQNVWHAEIFFDPQGHTERGVPFDAVLTGIRRALAEEGRNLGISSKLILCFLRHKSEADALETLEQARPHLALIDGFGLDSSEKPFPPRLFQRVFAAARSTGRPVMAHAGEEGPPEYVTEALELLQVDRIDHGNRSLEDPDLVARLVKMKMGLTVCPLSNLRLCGVGRLEDHPLKRMLELGLKATVNSDDPAYFGGYLNENFIAVAEALQLTHDDVVQLASNAIEVSFLTPEEKGHRLRELAAYRESGSASRRADPPEATGKIW